MCSLDLDEEGDHHGEHDERETEYVEERKGNKDLGGGQLVIGVFGVQVSECVSHEGHYSHLERDERGGSEKVGDEVREEVRWEGEGTERWEASLGMK